MKEINKEKKNNKGIPLFILFFIIIVILLIVSVILGIINKNKTILTKQMKTEIIVDIPNIEAETLPDLKNTTWKMSFFVEKIMGKDITEIEKQNA